MPLSPAQKHDLADAIRCYAFPPAYFDFETNVDVFDLSMGQVETKIRNQLTGQSPEQVKNGLACILYWGYSQMGGLAIVRARRFRDTVTQAKLNAAAKVFSNCRPSLREISKLRLPEFSGVSFVSKIRMFLDPDQSATLDKQIMKINEVGPTTVLAKITFSPRDTQIRITAKNSDAYEAWCSRLDDIRCQYFPDFRTVDIERGLFHLVQTRQISKAAGILNDA